MSKQPMLPRRNRSVRSRARKLLALLTACAVSAQTMATPITIGYVPHLLPASYLGYSVVPAIPGTDYATAAFGNFFDPNNSGVQTLHLALVDPNGHPMISKLITGFPADDVRAVSIINTDHDREFGLIIQAYNNGGVCHIFYVKVDENGNPLSNLFEIANAPNTNLYPQHAIFYHEQIYICGYESAILNNGLQDMSMLDAKQAFVARLDPTTGQTDFLYHNTTQNTNMPPGQTTGINDYDVAMRLKIMGGQLYVVGSGNGMAWSQTTGGQLYSINASEAFVAKVDPATFTLVNTAYFGEWTAGVNRTPAMQTGNYAVDIIEDPYVSGNYFCLSNKYQDTWQVTHLDNSFYPLGAPSTSDVNCVEFGAGRVKGYGLFAAHSGSTGTKLSVYGMTSDDLFLSSGTYGVDIEHAYIGAIPFVTSMEMSPSLSNNHFNYSNPNQYLNGNRPGMTSGLYYQQSYWANSNNMASWCVPQYGYQPDPAASGTSSAPGEIAMVANWSKGGSPIPKYIRSTADGAVPGCNGSQNSKNPQVKERRLEFTNVYWSDTQEWQTQATIWPPQLIVNDLDGDIYECGSMGAYKTTHTPLVTSAAPATVASIAPNPATDHITVSIAGATGDNLLDLRITDMAGREVFAVKAAAIGNSRSFALPAMARGIYQVTTRCNNGAPVTTKLSVE